MTAAAQPTLWDQPVPFQPRSDTSKAAARRKQSKVALQRKAVLAVYNTGAELTADECAAWLLVPGENELEKKLSIRPRVTELFNAGWLEDTGRRRRNDSGCMARVLRRARTTPSKGAASPRRTAGQRSGAGEAGSR